MRLYFRVCAVLIATLCCSAALVSQEVTGSIAGTVRDQTGAVVSGATVTITNTDKNVIVRTVTTSSNGDYSAPLLPIGHYSVTVEASGFKRAVQTGIELNVNDKLTISPMLELGSAQETVTVEASPLQVELQSAFRDVPAGTFRNGNSPRGGVRGPGFWRTDLALFKNTRITERVNTQVRLESLNTFNHTNPVCCGSTSLGSSSFGKILSTRDPRVVQLGLKLNF